VLFGGNNDAGSPFITLLAVDPHIIIKGIEHNLHNHFRESSINGHDYLRTIVQLPFFIQSQALPRVQAPPPIRNVSTNRADLLALNDQSGVQAGLSVSTHVSFYVRLLYWFFACYIIIFCVTLCVS
jgi:KAP family P-loop domain